MQNVSEMLSMCKSLIGTFMSIFIELQVYFILSLPLVCSNSASCGDSDLGGQVTSASQKR